MSRRRSRTRAWLRAALRAYPEPFRRQYGDELLEVFRERHSVAIARSRLAGFLCTLNALRGALWHGTVLRLETCRPLRALAADVRDASRSLRRAPGFALLVIGVLAVAVGANTAIFSIVHGTLLQERFDGEGLVMIWGSNPGNGQLRDVISGSNFVDFERSAQGFTHMAAFVADEVTLMEGARPEVVSGLTTTTGFFEAIGADASLGRLFDDRESTSGAEPVIVLSHEFWVRRFGANTGVIGRQLRVDGGAATVIGVLSQRFRFAFSADVYVPLYRDVIGQDARTHYHYWLIGRLRPGVSEAAAAAELDSELQRVASEEDPRMAPWSVLVEPVRASATAAVRPVLLGLLTSVALVLLIAVANLANLLAIRGAARGPELALRVALGAGGGRIVRQLLVEGLLLSGAGAATGFGVAAAILELLPRFVPATVAIPGSAARVASFHAEMDLTIAVFCIAVSLIAGIAFSLPAALGATRGNNAASLRQTDRTRTSSRRSARAFDALVGAEIALATLLVAGAIAATANLAELAAIDPGVDARGVVTMFVGDLQTADREARVSYYRAVLDRVARVPGVTAVGLNDYVPFLNEDDFEGIVFEDRPPRPPGEGIREEWRRVSGEYFDAAGIERLAGRGFEPEDFANGPSVAIVNAAFASKHYPDRDPVGERMFITDDDYRDTEIVGVVADVRRRGLTEPAPPVFYVPYHRQPRSLMSLFVRTSAAPGRHVEAIREAVWSVDPSQPIQGAQLLDDLVRASVGVPRLTMSVLLALAGTAIALAAVGIAGVVGYRVRARRRELGIRLALGATGARLHRQLLGWAARVGGLAIALGVAGAALIGPLLGAAPGVTSSAVLTLLAVVAGAMLALTLLATSLPARRILAIDPSESLRSD